MLFLELMIDVKIILQSERDFDKSRRRKLLWLVSPRLHQNFTKKKKRKKRDFTFRHVIMFFNKRAQKVRGDIGKGGRNKIDLDNFTRSYRGLKKASLNADCSLLGIFIPQYLSLLHREFLEICTGVSKMVHSRPLCHLTHIHS